MRGGKDLDAAVPETVYGKFDGVTWFLQKVMDRLYSETGYGGTCGASIVDDMKRDIVEGNGAIYTDLLYQLAPRQKELLLAINKEGRAEAITSGRFIKKHNLQHSADCREGSRCTANSF